MLFEVVHFENRRARLQRFDLDALRTVTCPVDLVIAHAARRMTRIVLDLEHRDRFVTSAGNKKIAARAKSAPRGPVARQWQLAADRDEGMRVAIGTGQGDGGEETTRIGM